VASSLTNVGLALIDMVKYEQAVPKLAEALKVCWATRVADGPGLVLGGLVRCEDNLGRKRMEELLKEAGFDGESTANMIKAIDQVRWKMGRARK
jgi:hypothetical protein